MLNLRHEIIESSKTFSNGVTVVNTTPYPLTFMEEDGTLKICLSSPKLLVNARAEEKVISTSPTLVKTTFVGTDEGEEIIKAIREVFPDAIIIGSIIAANAYKDVCGVCPCVGYERVAPAEKRMRTDKFNVGECF